MDILDRFVEQALRPPQDLGPPELLEPPEFPFQRQLHVVPAPARAIPSGTVADARERIRQIMMDYQATPQPDYMLLIKAAPGVGKTTLGIAEAERLALAGQRVLYAGPRHDFFADVMAAAGHPELWHEWLPRQAEDAERGREATCLHVEAITGWLSKGYDALDFCAGVCRWDYIKHGCVWHAQKATPKPIIFGQHAHVAMAHPMQFNVAFIDESPIAAFMHEWVIPAKWIAPSGLDITQPLTPMLHQMAGLAVGGAKLEGPELLEKLGSAPAVAEACELFRLAIDAVALAPKINHASDAEQADYFHLPQLVQLLHREAAACQAGREYPHRIILANGNLLMLLRRPGNDTLPPHVIALDATAEPRQYEAVFKRPVQVVDASPALVGKVYQVYDRANGKTAVKDDVAARQLKQQVAAIAKRYECPAVITYQALTDAIDMPSLHFYAARGTNQFQNCDALIVAGTPQPPRHMVDRAARMIFAERMLPFIANWIVELRTYAYTDPNDGQGRAYPVSGFWSDPDLQAVMWSLREAELIQAAHRARPILRQCDIWLLTNVPLPELPPARLVSIQEVMGAPNGVHIFKWDTVLWYAENLAKSQGYVTAQDLMQGFDLDKKTAHKYMNLLIEQFGWQQAIVPSTGGRPPKAVKLRGL